MDADGKAIDAEVSIGFEQIERDVFGIGLEGDFLGEGMRFLDESEQIFDEGGWELGRCAAAKVDGGELFALDEGKTPFPLEVEGSF